MSHQATMPAKPFYYLIIYMCNNSNIQILFGCILVINKTLSHSTCVVVLSLWVRSSQLQEQMQECKIGLKNQFNHQRLICLYESKYCGLPVLILARLWMDQQESPGFLCRSLYRLWYGSMECLHIWISFGTPCNK